MDQIEHWQQALGADIMQVIAEDHAAAKKAKREWLPNQMTEALISAVARLTSRGSVFAC